MTLDIKIPEYEQALIIITKVNVDNKRTVYTAWDIRKDTPDIIAHNTDIYQLSTELDITNYTTI